MRSRFGIKDAGGDARLQRPEYLGGSTQTISVHPVPQQSESGTTAQGNLAGFGTSFGQNGFTKSFTEHGYVLGLWSARADLTYMQGLDRMWSRSTRYDYFMPEMEGLGEQAVLSKEIYADGGVQDDDVFGYIPRYDEYRFKRSNITGLFRSDATGSLDPWHLSEEFGTRPTLNSTFIECNTPVDRVIAVTTEPHLIMDGFIDLKCARPLSVHGVPGLRRI